MNFLFFFFHSTPGTKALLHFKGDVNIFKLWHKYRTAGKFRVKGELFSFVKLGVFEQERTTSYLYRQIHPGKQYPWMKPITDLIGDMLAESMDWISVPSETDSSKSIGDLPWLTDVESSLYIYLEFLRSQKFQFDLKFPFVNSRDWVHIIAETIKMDHQVINLDALNPDESIELWYTSTEFYNVKSHPPDREDILLKLQPHTTENFENTNIMVTISSEYNIPGEFLIWRSVIQKHVSQLWQGYLDFSNQKLIEIISLQGEYKEMFVQSMKNNTNTTLNVYWIKTTNQKFHFYRDAKLIGSWKNHHCLKYITSDADRSSDKTSSLDFAFIYQITIRYKQKTGFRGTWLEAYKLCYHFGGFLPILRSKEELDQLISILKLPVIPPPPMKIMFIGLTSYRVSTKINLEHYK